MHHRIRSVSMPSNVNKANVRTITTLRDLIIESYIIEPLHYSWVLNLFQSPYTLQGNCIMSNDTSVSLFLFSHSQLFFFFTGKHAHRHRTTAEKKKLPFLEDEFGEWRKTNKLGFPRGPWDARDSHSTCFTYWHDIVTAKDDPCASQHCLGKLVMPKQETPKLTWTHVSRTGTAGRIRPSITPQEPSKRKTRKGCEGLHAAQSHAGWVLTHKPWWQVYNLIDIWS